MLRLDWGASLGMAAGSKMIPSVARPKRRGVPSQGRRPGQRCRGPSAAITYGGYAPVETVAHEFRERFAADGDLAGLKLFLLAGLLVLAALLERGM